MNLKNIIFLVGGGAIGAVTTYFCMKDKCNKLVDEETSAIKKYYEEKYNTENEDKPNDIPEEVKKEPEEEKEEPNYEEIIEKLNYNEFSTRTSSNKKAKRPYLITEEDFVSDTTNVKKIISFFEDDEICMDNDTKEVLENVAQDIGNDCLEQINERGANEIYVRNEVLGIDYNVVSEPGSYEDFLDE